MAAYGYTTADDEVDRYVPLAEAAERMNLTEDQVYNMAVRGVLRSRRWAGWGDIEVEPAIVNVPPRPPRKRPAKRAPTAARE